MLVRKSWELLVINYFNKDTCTFCRIKCFRVTKKPNILSQDLRRRTKVVIFKNYCMVMVVTEVETSSFIDHDQLVNYSQLVQLIITVYSKTELLNIKILKYIIKVLK